MKTSPMFLIALCLLTGCTRSTTTTPEAPIEAPDALVSVKPIADVEWGALNPARGDASPRAGTLWGDRGGEGPTGFLVKFEEGFQSPPHIHNVSYRGVVIHGLVHNDDPGAEAEWMSTGSFWTQPAGASHITSASGGENMAYIEIDSGPYLVHPTEDAFGGEERPVNVDASNVVWVDAASIGWGAGGDAPSGAKVAFLWGSPDDERPAGVLVKFSAARDGSIRSLGSLTRAVVIRGHVDHHARGGAATRLDPGSYLEARAGVTRLSCASDGGECVLYVRTNGALQLATSPE